MPLPASAVIFSSGHSSVKCACNSSRRTISSSAIKALGVRMVDAPRTSRLAGRRLQLDQHRMQIAARNVLDFVCLGFAPKYIARLAVRDHNFPVGQFDAYL